MKKSAEVHDSMTVGHLCGLVLQFFLDADDVDTWMLDMLRLVSSEDVGHDEASVQSLVKKHKVCCICLFSFSLLT